MKLHTNGGTLANRSHLYLSEGDAVVVILELEETDAGGRGVGQPASTWRQSTAANVIIALQRTRVHTVSSLVLRSRLPLQKLVAHMSLAQTFLFR